MKHYRFAFSLALAALLCQSPAQAQLNVKPQSGTILFGQAPDGSLKPVQVDSSGNLVNTGSFSASVSGFAENGSTANLSVSTTSADVALPSGTTVKVVNAGAADVHFRVTIGAGTAVTTDQVLKSGAATGVTVGSNTHISAITDSGTSTLSLAGGAGLVSGYGGGSSSGGGGGSISNLPTTVDTNSGNKSASTIRVVIATDQPQTTTALKTDSSATTQPVSATSLPLPALAATSTKQSDGSQKTQIVDGSGNVIASTSNNLNVQCANCSGSGVSAADEATFIAGTSLQAAAGGFFQTTATNNALTNGQQGMAQMTANRAVFNNLRNASGTEVGTASTPLQVSLANTGSNSTAVAVTSGVAQGSTSSGQTVSPIAGRTLSTTPTDTTAQTNAPVLNLNGGLVTNPYALPDVLVQGTTSAMTGTTSTSLVAAPGSGLHNYITSLSCVNSHATVGTFVTVQDGSGGTAIWTVAAAAVFGGTVVTFPAPLRQPTANTALFVADVTTGANVICSASGYKAP